MRFAFATSAEGQRAVPIGRDIIVRCRPGYLRAFAVSMISLCLVAIVASLTKKNASASLRPSIGRDKGIGFRTFATIFLEAQFKSLEGRRAFVQRDAKRSAFSSHFENACCPQRIIERALCKRNRHTLRFGQRLGLHGLRASGQANRIDFSPFELPFG